MNLLIYLTCAGAIFLWSDLFFSYGLPCLSLSYQKWHQSRASRMAGKLEESFIFVERKKVVFFTLSPLLMSLLTFILVRNPLSLGIGFFLGLIIPNLIINIAWQKRIRQFRSQLVDTIMIISSSLKANLSIIQAIATVSEEMPAPISQEFGLILKENKLGMTMEESLRLLRKRIPLEEVNLLVASILVARESGGELTKVLSRLTETIRNNLKLKEKILTLTLQGRLQGTIMAILPIIFSWFIYRQNPQHFDIMLESELGKMLLIGAVLAQLIGMYLIKRISAYKG